MEFFKQNTRIDFMGLRRYAAIVSLLFFALSIAGLGIRGLNWGLDFTGGTQVQLSFPTAPNLSDIRSKLSDAQFTKFTVQHYGSSRDVLVSFGIQKGLSASNEHQEQTKLQQKLISVLPKATVESVNYLGATVSSELAYKGFLAVVVALLATIIYIALRFEYRLAVSAGIAMIHDPIIILGVFSWLGLQFDLTALAAVLTVIGYSLNDTIVVFDRIRENFRQMRRTAATDVVNASVNQTLSRTIMTSSLTMIVVVVLFFFGGPTIHGFSLALIIGIVVGTYSSIYVAGAFSLFMGLNRKDLLPAAKQELEDMP